MINIEDSLLDMFPFRKIFRTTRKGNSRTLSFPFFIYIAYSPLSYLFFFLMNYVHSRGKGVIVKGFDYSWVAWRNLWYTKGVCSRKKEVSRSKVRGIKEKRRLKKKSGRRNKRTPMCTYRDKAFLFSTKEEIPVYLAEVTNDND